MTYCRILSVLTIVIAIASFPRIAAWSVVPLSVEGAALQLIVGAASYVGLIALLDRPQGTLPLESSLVVAPSQVKGAGLGLYASKEIPKNTVLGTYPGVVMPLEQGLVKLRLAPCCETYIWRFSDSRHVIDPTDLQGKVHDYTCGGNPSTYGSVLLCQTLLSSFQVPTMLCRINEPPVGRDRNVCTEEELDKRIVKFVTERTVFAGEEFFIDYGLTYDRSGYTGATRRNS